MKKFLFKISFYIIGIIAVLLFLGTYADGNTDDNYLHFTGPKPSDMIMGDSRGSQAVIPNILDDKLKGRKFNNFSLNITESPYGQIYFEGIKKKLNPDTKDGIFILTVDPWNLSVDKNVKETKDLSENNSALADMHFYDVKPNYEYLLKHYHETWFNIYRDREALARSSTYLHQNGWMEVNVNVEPDTLKKRQDRKVADYTEFVKSQKISRYRLDAFEDIIDYLKTKGTVYIVRIPGFKGIMEIENKYSPDFSKRIESIAHKKGVRFFDFSQQSDQYIFTDGNHMYKESGKVFTARIADSILLDKKNN
ncbi:hypothetical protein BN1195_00580 [Chryseobacterium oranimense G311]|uniref:hypothetical protein n=1 Tax=Chryseobacterium oranimense TaxID=421058 RepID=UPI000533B146|nr:hypothetical protein [Chryseobacterium oranimense]CEJ68298.1 hypothetical protein BN1195_00580 [Chryseobacterium oranimense G311]